MPIFIEKIIKLLSNIKLAVFVILSLAVLSAIGTIYESKFDAQYAQKLIYHSKYMYSVLGLLCINLIFVMVDRWPWKRHHSGFIFAHIGIIITLLGAFITQKFGVDGSMSFPIGKSNRFVTVTEQEVNVFSSYENSQPVRVFNRAVDFFSDPPKKTDPLVINLGSEKMELNSYYHYAFGKEDFVESSKTNSGVAVRLQVQNKFANLTQWVFKNNQSDFETFALGPAQIVLHDGKYKYQEGNVVELLRGKNNEISFFVHSKDLKKKVKKGVVGAGESIETGWMDTTIRILKYIPNAEKRIEFYPREYPTAQTRSAVLVNFGDQQQWVGLNSVVKFYTNDKVYYFSYGNRRIDLGFDIKLVDFKVGNYQGTNRAMSYESDVDVPGLGKVNISMNEPMKHDGYTFYQASFEKDERDQPVVSILSVNKDPGRPLKYLGSFLIVLGSIILFYFKRKRKVNSPLGT